ncbi:MAG: CCA tRNA nucleotidyltransferase [Planctomycetota bacterium]
MTPEQFAIDVTRKLQQAGFQALFAGGCVRDELLGRIPKDYDVATNARPDEVREVFGKKKTIAIGAAFGVITVIGPRSAGQIEVATFRRDGDYHDGRRPDSVEYTDAREDALRRDFTINGMFYDPVSESVIDYVGGQEDLELRRIRAIGNPHERIDEDKLRMLRGVRFAATYEFELDDETLAAIEQHAHEIKVVSPERIGNELRRMLGSHNNHVALRLLIESRLWAEVFIGALEAEVDLIENRSAVESLERLKSPAFPAAVATILLEMVPELMVSPSSTIERLKDVWRLTNSEVNATSWLCANISTARDAARMPWPDVQPVLIHELAPELLRLADAIFPENDGTAFCRERLEWSREKLNPEPLVNGGDLKNAGVTPGPMFKQALDMIRRKQLDGEIATREEALEFARAFSAD